MPPVFEPRTALGRVLWDLTRDGTPLETFTVLSKEHDPYRLDTPTGHREAEWFKAQMPIGPVHLRGLHYRLTAAANVKKPDGRIYINSFADWRWLSESASKAARWLGYVPFDRIVDERNAPAVVWEPAPDIHPSASISTGGGYIEVPDQNLVLPEAWCGKLAAPQPYRIILAGEKSSLDDVLRPLAELAAGELNLPNGDMTDTMIYHLARRAAEDGRPAVVLYFSDFDPSGWNMPVVLARKLQALSLTEFPGLTIEVHAVALTLDQVRKNTLPSTPLKETESRGDKWKRYWRHEQTEIDALAALKPDVLRDIARSAMAPFFDFSLDDRANRARLQWRAKANAQLQAHPDYEAVCGEITDALTDVEAAVDALGEVQQQGIDRLQMTLPEIARVEPEITAAPPPPLFTTDDSFVSATRRLIDHRKIYDDEE